MEQVSPAVFFPLPQYSSLHVTQNMTFGILASYEKLIWKVRQWGSCWSLSWFLSPPPYICIISSCMTYAYTEAGGSRLFHNVGTYLPDYMVTLCQ